MSTISMALTVEWRFSQTRVAFLGEWQQNGTRNRSDLLCLWAKQTWTLCHFFPDCNLCHFVKFQPRINVNETYILDLALVHRNVLKWYRYKHFVHTAHIVQAAKKDGTTSVVWGRSHGMTRFIYSWFVKQGNHYKWIWIVPGFNFTKSDEHILMSDTRDLYTKH